MLLPAQALKNFVDSKRVLPDTIGLLRDNAARESSQAGKVVYVADRSTDRNIKLTALEKVYAAPLRARVNTHKEPVAVPSSRRQSISGSINNRSHHLRVAIWHTPAECTVRRGRRRHYGVYES